MKNKTWDIVQPKDNWGRNYAHMEYLWMGCHIMLVGKRIKVSCQEVMTGSEWLYRFQVELTNWMMVAPDNTTATIMKAAKRASGLA